MSNQQNTEKHYIRLIGTDVDANKSLFHGLSSIKGVKHMFANAICVKLGLDRNKQLKDLSEEEIQNIENFVENPEGLPTWLYNKRKEYATGENKHLFTKDLEYDHMQIKRRLYRIRSYRGIRLRERLTVRGQRTRSNHKKTRKR